MAKKRYLQLQEVKKKDRTALTLFLIMFPSILIAGDFGLDFPANLALKGALIFYQFVILKRFLDDYYKSY
jgi:hypothetical protein